MDGSRLAKQVAGSALANSWLTLVGLFTTPYLLLGLGSAGYGIFAMVSVVSVHLSNLEFGFGQATVRYLARARAASDMERERVIVETSFAVFLAGGLTGAVLLFAGAPYLVSSIFHIERALQPEALTAFRLGAFILACSFISSFFSSVLQVFGRFDWLNGSRAVFGTVAAVSAVGAVAAGGGIDAVFVLQAGVACLSSLTLGVGVIRNWKGGVLPRIAPDALREMGAYAILAFLGGLAYQWMVNGAPLVLAAYVDAAEIPAFSVPHMVLQKLTVLIASASLAFLPFASAASTAADRSRLRASRVRACRGSVPEAARRGRAASRPFGTTGRRGEGIRASWLGARVHVERCRAWGQYLGRYHPFVRDGRGCVRALRECPRRHHSIAPRGGTAPPGAESVGCGAHPGWSVCRGSSRDSLVRGRGGPWGGTHRGSDNWEPGDGGLRRDGFLVGSQA